jgi:signal transduction histidine kinase/ActR/RegA family two-component response regulator
MSGSRVDVTPSSYNTSPRNEMRARIGAHDWSATPVGPTETWPKTLQTAVSICLGSRYPIVLWWGRETLTQFYNDGYIPVLGGTKHPHYLGRSGRECWSEIWDVIKPMFDLVFDTGEATWAEDLLLVLDRKLPREEGYFTFSYSPIPDDAGEVGGVFCAVTETTGRVIGERRLRALRDLGRAASETKTVEEACQNAARVLETNPADVPFALIYLFDDAGESARLVATTGIARGTAASPFVIDLGAGPLEASSCAWPIHHALRAQRPELVTGLPAGCGTLPGGQWPEPAEQALIVPIAGAGQSRPAGCLIGGLSPRRVIDADYRAFFDLVAGHIGAAIGNARAYEAERKRAETLAELDRAKTAFFSNVSHEFRTPLTLLLGPAGEALADPDATSRQRERLELMHRNALRLQRLVNALLDFSRIEAGRIDVAFEPTDLGTYTRELASGFRSAIERAGLSFVFDIAAQSEPVYVDREMWEKIVLNLLSNALKHTFDGAIAVRLDFDERNATLSVRDTGVGIPADQLTHVFERFHRVPNAKSRTHEGTGIGLALVRELVNIHGGRVDVTSEEGRGTTFTVCIPRGTAHLPADRVGAQRTLASTAVGAKPYVDEAMRWLSAEPVASADTRSDLDVAERPDSTHGARILIADDNADMRDYIARVLRSGGWSVEAVADGEAALAAVRRHAPDLVLSDVMMPGVDGFGLLRALRADAATRDLSVILLSARAGEEARVEGLDAGADDYLIKPFSARELVARVGGVLRLAHLRREADAVLRESEERFRALVTATSDVIYRMSPDWSETRQFDGRDFIAGAPPRTWLQTYIPAEDREHVQAVIHYAIRTRNIFELEHRINRPDGTTGWAFSRAIPIVDQRDEIVEWFGMASDVTRRRLAEEALVVKTEQAEAANRAKSDFLATMSHELRTPLNAIAGHAELLELGIYGALTREQVDAIGRIQRSERHLLSVINDILNFAKIEAGRVEYQLEDVTLDTIVAEAIGMSELHIRAKGLQWTTAVAHDAVVLADRERLKQVLINLISNAVKFTGPGGELAIATVSRSGASPATVHLRIADTGIGIPLEKQEAIFDPFVQVHRNLTRSTEGTGLGLAISRDLARGMGGDLRVRSREGLGSRFTLTLPRAEPPRAPTSILR